MADVQLQEQRLYQTSIPEYARRYVEDLLGVGAGVAYRYKTEPVLDAQGKPVIGADGKQVTKVVTDASGMPEIAGFQPYQQYTGERFAQFTPLQRQAMEAAGQAQVPGQMYDASQIAKMASQMAGATAYAPSQYQTQSFTQPGATQQYMSPYMQNVVDIEKREAQRQADIARTNRGAQFAKAGAFGGARQAIENAEAQRNLATQMGDIQSRGLQAAYQQAAGQFNAEQAARQAAAQLREQSSQYGAGLGLQGLQTALTGAGQLGNLGQNIYGQYTGNINLQNQLGQQQQQQMQNMLNANYQDFLNAQNQPYKQLGFISDLLRGTQGLGQQSMYSYQPPVPLTNQLIGLGGTAATLGRMGGFKEGGRVGAGLADLAISRMA